MNIMQITDKMIKAGNQIAADLLDAAISKDMDGLGGGATLQEWKEKNIKNQDLILKHISGEIDTVTAIYMAMHREAEKSDGN